MAFDDLCHGILAVAGGVNYSTLGQRTGALAVKVLTQNIKPETIPVEIVSDQTIHVHQETLKHLGLLMPKHETQNIKIKGQA